MTTKVLFTLQRAEYVAPGTIASKLREAFPDHAPELEGVSYLGFENSFTAIEEKPKKPKKAEEPKPVEEPKKAEEPVKAEEPKKAEEPVKAEEPKPAEEPKKEITKDDIKAILFEVRQKYDSDRIKGLMEQYAEGAATLRAVKPEHYAALYSAAKEALNA